MFDVITIGSATRDIFVETDKAQILSSRSVERKTELYCLNYGEKIEIDQSSFEIGGGAVNTAVSLSALGLYVSAAIKIGDGHNGNAVMARLEDKKIDTSLVIRTHDFRTGFSVILTSFEGDRTVLAHRGANRSLRAEDIDWETMKDTKWFYCAPLSNESNKVLDVIAAFVKEHGLKMAYTPGGTDFKRDHSELKTILNSANIVFMNKSEASKLTGIIEKTETKHDIAQVGPVSAFVKEMLLSIKCFGPEIVVITDGKNGVYAYNGTEIYFAPPFPARVISTLGAGDAFASTLVGCFIKCDCDLQKSIALASINAASVVEQYGAQSGLKTYNELEHIYENHPEYRAVKFNPNEI